MFFAGFAMSYIPFFSGTHTFVVSMFCSAGMTHMTVMMGQSDRLEDWRKMACKICAIGSNIGRHRQKWDVFVLEDP